MESHSNRFIHSGEWDKVRKMCSPQLKELPSVSPDRKGWPWTVASPSLPERMSDGRPWPKITIVTPSFNQGGFIEETIRSVLLQNYPNLEYIIVDGGSSDGTVEIIQKYSSWLVHWVSESDRGQSHAINKGFSRGTGEILAYINSDDLYEPGALACIADTYVRAGRPDLIVGVCPVFSDKGEERLFKPSWPDDLSFFLNAFGSSFAQPSSFWSRDIYCNIGGFNESLHYALDREFFLRIGLCGVRPVLLDRRLARYRSHYETKTRRTIKFYEESLPIITQYGTRCGLSDQQIRKRIHYILNQIAYLQIFSIWKRSGRLPAIFHFGLHMIKSPDFLRERKVLGLARRLIMFRESDVLELRNV